MNAFNNKEKIKSLPPGFWLKYFKVYDILNLIPPYVNLLNRLIEILQPSQREKILDAGVGTGNLAVLLARRGADVYGLDFSPEALKIYKDKDPNAKTFLHDLRSPLPFEDNFFDKIVSNNVLYNIPREERLNVILELRRVLKPGGIIVLSNIHKDFSPFKIYVSSIKESVQTKGLITTIYLILKLIIPTIQMFYYNFQIQKIHKTDKNNLFDFEEQKHYLTKAKFSFVSDTELTYAGQAILNYAIK